MSNAVSYPVVGRVGYLVLDRAQTLNALDLEMCRVLTEALNAHIANPAVERIVIRSGNARAFCAGGDMKHIRELVLTDQLDQVEEFFRIEYTLNLAIAECPKPYIALIDGIAMGGGLGVSVHGSHRLLTERALVAMPETRIGLFPDVGGTHFLPRLAHRAGWWLALTSEAVRGYDGVSLGIGTHCLSSASSEAVCRALETETGTVDDVIAPYLVNHDDTDFTALLDRREPWFAASTLDGILKALDTDASDDAVALATRVRSGSPSACQLTLALFERHAKASLADALDGELDAVKRSVRHPDLAEGVRAVLVDKDHAPHWQ